MPLAEWSGVIRSSVEEVLETMFLTCLEDDAPADGVPPVISSTLTFRGNPSGALQVEVSEAAARELAGNFLGDDEVAPAHTGEVICELANMICGSVLGQLGSETLFDLSSPQQGAALSGEFFTERFAIPGGALAVSIQLTPAG